MGHGQKEGEGTPFLGGDGGSGPLQPGVPQGLCGLRAAAVVA